MMRKVEGFDSFAESGTQKVASTSSTIERVMDQESPCNDGELHLLGSGSCRELCKSFATPPHDSSSLTRWSFHLPPIRLVETR